MRKFVVVATLIVASALGWAKPAPANDEAGVSVTLSEAKARAEIEKLRAETDELLATHAAIGPSTKFWTTWLAAVSGTLPVLLGIAGYLVNRNQRRRIKQEQEFAQEKHLLEVFRDLGDDSDRIRLGALGILIQRIARVRKLSTRSHTIDADDLGTLVSVVINATKTESSLTLQKYVADGLATALQARTDGNLIGPRSPLALYDFQGARLAHAWWKGVDARGVDFYRASLKRAGMRGAHFSHATLRLANLREAVLADAQLQGANLTDANLASADLTGADLTEADLRRANLRGANLRRATLTRAKVAGADLSGADLTDARFDSQLLKEAIITGAVGLAVATPG